VRDSISKTGKGKATSSSYITSSSSNAKAEILLPTHIFQDRDVSVLEAISEYMKDSMGLTYHEIAVMLSRDDRTIWTCYNRAKAKRKK
jgi:hypothetical protein